MTLPEILKAVRQWWWILLICPIIAGLLAYFASASMTPVYEAESTAMVEHQLSAGGSDLQSIQAAERRTQTFTQLVISRSVLERVVERLDLDLQVTDLRQDVSVSHTRETQLVTVRARDPDPDRAALIANTIASEFAAYIDEIQPSVSAETDGDLSESLAQLEGQIETTTERISELQSLDDLSASQEEELVQQLGLLEQLEIAEEFLLVAGQTFSTTGASAGSEVFVVESAAAPNSPVSPRPMLNTALAGILGLLLGGGLVVLVAWLDDNVKSEQDARRVINRPVIGTVPVQELPDQMESIHAERSISGEIFRGLRTNLQFTMVDRNVKSLVVTSVHPGEGKTTVAANLAIVLAQGGQRVILVDADMRRPRVHNMFHKVRNDRGLSNLLLQSPAVIESVIQSTTIANLKVLTTGPVPPNPPDLYGSARMKALVNALEESADIIIFDSPPLALSESLLLASLADGILLVIRAGKSRTSEIANGAESAEQTGVPILGVVLNGVPSDSQSAYRVYQQYYPLVSSDEKIPIPKRRSGWISRMFTRSA